MVCNNILEAIGHTPIIRLNKMNKPGNAEVLVKFEGLNVGGSIKTRTAFNMIRQAEKEGLINKDTIIVEPTSGNQGIGLALVGAVRGYKVVIIMPDSVSEERRKLVKNYGDLLLMWFDVPHTITKEQSLRLNKLVKEYQPDCLINSRIGNGAYDYVSLGDNEIPPSKEEWEKLSRVDTDNVNYQSIDGFKPSKYGLYESACTLNDSWGFCYRDHNWKSPEELYKNKKHLNDLGINYLINVGPDHLGRIPEPSIEILKRASEF